MDGNGPVLDSNLALDVKARTAPRSDRCLHPKDQLNLGEKSSSAGSGSLIGVDLTQVEKAWTTARSVHCLHRTAQRNHRAMKSGAGSGLVLLGVRNLARERIALTAVRCDPALS